MFYWVSYHVLENVKCWCKMFYSWIYYIFRNLYTQLFQSCNVGQNARLQAEKRMAHVLMDSVYVASVSTEYLQLILIQKTFYIINFFCLICCFHILFIVLYFSKANERPDNKFKSELHRTNIQWFKLDRRNWLNGKIRIHNLPLQWGDM